MHVIMSGLKHVQHVTPFDITGKCAMCECDTGKCNIYRCFELLKAFGGPNSDASLCDV